MASDSKVIKAGIGYTIGNYLLKGLSFFTIPVFSRLLSPDDYGIFNTFGAYESILYVILGCAIHSSYKNARYKYRLREEGALPGEDYYTYVSNTLLFIILSGGIWLLLANMTAEWASPLLGLDRLCLNLLVIESFASAVLICFNTDVSLRYQYKSFLAVAAVNAVGNTVLSILLILTVFRDVRYMGRILGVVIPLLLIAAGIIRSMFLRARPNGAGRMLSWGLRYSLPIVPHGISQIILNSFDRIMIHRMVSSAAAGIYSFAYNVYSIVVVTAASIETVWTPWFYERRNSRDYEAIRKASSIYMVFLLFMCSETMLLSPEIVRILGPEAYRDSAWCVIPVVAGGFFAFMYNMPAAVEYYHEKTRYIAAATTMAAVLNIGLNYIGIRRFGYIAAAYTTLITYAAYFTFHYALARKIEGRFLFSNKTLISCVIGLSVAIILSIGLIQHLVCRIVIAVVAGSLFILYEEKKFGLIGKRLKK